MDEEKRKKIRKGDGVFQVRGDGMCYNARNINNDEKIKDFVNKIATDSERPIEDISKSTAEIMQLTEEVSKKITDQIHMTVGMIMEEKYSDEVILNFLPSLNGTLCARLIEMQGMLMCLKYFDARCEANQEMIQETLNETKRNINRIMEETVVAFTKNVPMLMMKLERTRGFK